MPYHWIPRGNSEELVDHGSRLLHHYNTIYSNYKFQITPLKNLPVPNGGWSRKLLCGDAVPCHCVCLCIYGSDPWEATNPCYIDTALPFFLLCQLNTTDTKRIQKIRFGIPHHFRKLCIAFLLDVTMNIYRLVVLYLIMSKSRPNWTSSMESKNQDGLFGQCNINKNTFYMQCKFTSTLLLQKLSQTTAIKNTFQFIVHHLVKVLSWER